ncbi:hypothetical protein BG003_005218, partial [Podila horticola]
MQDVIDTAKKLRIPENVDFNGSNQNGVGKYQVTMKDGRRWSFVDGYLTEALKTRIEAYSKLVDGLQSEKYVAVLNGVNVKSESRVTRILWNEHKGSQQEAIAQGVEFIYQGEKHKVYLNPNGELLLSAGAINTPQILMLSGSASIFDQSIANPAKNVAPFNGDGFTLAPVLNIPESVGWLELTSSDPIDPPRIFVNYYDKPSDLYRMISAVKLARKVIKSMKPSLNAKELGFKDEYGNWQSGDEMTDEEYELYIRAKTYTSFHPCGTTKMAPRDNGGVVDHHLRVYGTKHLRVVDASIFPTIPS